jgi:hypothetical protein
MKLVEVSMILARERRFAFTTFDVKEAFGQVTAIVDVVVLLAGRLRKRIPNVH